MYFCLQKRNQINTADCHQSEKTCHDKPPLLRTKLSYANLFSTISENVLELTAILVLDIISLQVTKNTREIIRLKDDAENVSIS